ncbi:inositol oxygenase [Puniceicoccaceae bacterium K14]|nr:inositol oxygenase [Puniceicoccaceae bacterium K14]
MNKSQQNGPLNDLDEWEDDLLERYPNPGEKKKEEFRSYDNPARDTVKEFYRLNHINQTYDFVLKKEQEYLGLNRTEMSLREAIDYLNTLVDDSDPDIDLDQAQHLFQTSEAIRADGLPDWMVLTGLLHDLGKVLCLFGEAQWAVVGDTFPVGCAFSEKIIYWDYFKENPDYNNSRYNTKYGVYEPNCGLKNVHMSWGHDEYIYNVLKDYLPEPALYILRYHSFYPQHRENAYSHLMTDHDHEMFKYVNQFNQYDLYTKSPVKPNVAELMPLYEDIASNFLPDRIRF